MSFVRFAMAAVVCAGVLSACEKKSDSGSKDGTPAAKPTITEGAFADIMKLGYDSVIRRAKAGDLGACRVVKNSSLTACSYREDEFGQEIVYLADKKLFYPKMVKEITYGTRTSDCITGSREKAYRELGVELEFALKEGFCYNIKKDTAVDLDGVSLFRKAISGELANCEIKKVNKVPGDNNCNTAVSESYVIYIRGQFKYYPSMSGTEPAAGMCQVTAERYIKSAYQEGFCR